MEKLLAWLGSIAGILGAVVAVLTYFNVELVLNRIRPPEITKFFVDPPVARAGGTTLLKWRTKNANDCRINWIDADNRNREETVTPTGELREPVGYNAETITFLLTCWTQGLEASQSTTVHIKADKPPPLEAIYIGIVKVMEWLDCDRGSTEEQRSLNLTNDFFGRRIHLEKNVTAIDNQRNAVRLSRSLERTWGSLAGEHKAGRNIDGPVTVEFSADPKAIFRNPFQFASIKLGQRVFIDCRVADYCKSGLLSENPITLDDCKLLER